MASWNLTWTPNCESQTERMREREMEGHSASLRPGMATTRSNTFARQNCFKTEKYAKIAARAVVWLILLIALQFSVLECKSRAGSLYLYLCV